MEYEIRKAFFNLKRYHDKLTPQQFKTLKGQIIAGEPAAAMKGLWKILNKEKTCKDSYEHRETHTQKH